MKVLLVDGYNVIRCTPPYRHIAEDDLESAREALVNDVAAFAQGEWDATVVFDGGNNPHSDGLPHRIAGITVRFSPYGHTADSVIEGLARLARERGVRTDVVTSDAQTQWTVLGDNVARRSAKEFSHELRIDEADWRESNPSGSSASRIEDRIDPNTRAVLERWARGES
ncbi:MAG TPA: NYN domain-containing protein [Coriobacteriia bacterium]|nr:NYN domain-containing protein [Coriobacteriia bacterium]